MWKDGGRHGNIEILYQMGNIKLIGAPIFSEITNYCVCLHRRYFGEKVGIYFTWIGFYTTWLLPASIVGIIVLIYGLTTVVNPVA